MRAIKYSIFAVLTFITIPQYSFAGDLSDKLLVNGYFTLDATYANERVHLVSNSASVQSFEANDFSIDNSIIGAQVQYNIDDNLKIFAQGTAFKDNDNDYTAELDWLYLSHDLGYDYQIRVGKFQIPFLKGTEVRNIGVTRLWARPLIPSNGAGGYNYFKGVELLKRVATDEGNWQFQASVGEAEHGLSNISNKHFALISVFYQAENYWIRGSALQADYAIYTNSGNKLSNSAQAFMYSLESEYLYDNYIFNLGFSTTNTDYTPNDTNVYFSAGYTFNNITPYIYYSYSNQDFDAWSTLPPNRPLPANEQNLPPPPPPPDFAPSNIPDGDFDVTSVAIGAQYYINESYVLKLQLENVQEDNEAFEELPKSTSGNAISLVFEGVF